MGFNINSIISQSKVNSASNEDLKKIDQEAEEISIFNSVKEQNETSSTKNTQGKDNIDISNIVEEIVSSLVEKLKEVLGIEKTEKTEEVKDVDESAKTEETDEDGYNAQGWKIETIEADGATKTRSVTKQQYDNYMKNDLDGDGKISEYEINYAEGLRDVNGDGIVDHKQNEDGTMEKYAYFIGQEPPQMGRKDVYFNFDVYSYKEGSKTPGEILNDESIPIHVRRKLWEELFPNQTQKLFQDPTAN